MAMQRSSSRRRVSKSVPVRGKVADDVLFFQESKRPEMGERVPIPNAYGTRESPYYNPDDLVSRKGLEIYDRMGTDDQVAAAIEVKTLSRLSTSWDIHAASEDPRDREIRDFVADVLNDIPGSLDNKLRELMSAIKYGFVVGEKVWEYRKSGTWAGKLAYRDIKARSPFSFQFVVDLYGNLMPNGVEVILNWRPPPDKPLTGARLRTDKFVIWAYRQQFSNVYGRSDLRPAYRSWFSKDFIIKFFNAHIERYASPTAVAHIPDHLSPSDTDKVLKILETVQNQTVIVLPEGVELQYMESRLGGAIAFRFSDAIDMHNRFIARAILIPDLMGYSGSVAGGSFALGKKQIDVYFMILEALGSEMEEGVVGEQIIRPLVDANYANVDRYPRFRFRGISADLDVRARIFKVLAEAGGLDPREDWVRGYLDLPERALPPPLADVFTAAEMLRRREGVLLRSLICPACKKALRQQWAVARCCGVGYHVECFEATERCTKCGSGVAQFVAVTFGARGEPVIHDMDMRVVPGTRPLIGEAAPLVLPEAPSLGDEDLVVQFGEGDAVRRPAAPGEAGVNFRRMVRTGDALVADAVSQARPIFREMRDRMIEFLRKRHTIARKRLEDIDNLPANVGGLSRLLRGFLMTAAGNGAYEAATELATKLRGVGETRMVEDEVVSGVVLSAPEARDHFGAAKIPTTKQVIRIDLSGFIDDYFAQRSYLLAGIEKSYILDQARLILSNAILQGDPRMAEEQIAAMFDAFLPTGASKGGRLTKPARLYTVLTTAYGGAFNQGRRTIFEGAVGKDVVRAYQWSAVIDANTTEYCRRLDGKVFPPHVIATLFPPAHLHCRSTIIALIEGESFEFSKVDPISPAAGVTRAAGFTDGAQAVVPADGEKVSFVV